MAYTQATNKAVQKYVKSHYDRIEIKDEKGLKDTVRAAAEEAGQSVNAYILQAIEERMQREQARQAQLPDV